jgi:hypothetical protein
MLEFRPGSQPFDLVLAGTTVNQCMQLVASGMQLPFSYVLVSNSVMSLETNR